LNASAADLVVVQGQHILVEAVAHIQALLRSLDLLLVPQPLLVLPLADYPQAPVAIPGSMLFLMRHLP
jgi:hypothetical protein